MKVLFLSVGRNPVLLRTSLHVIPSSRALLRGDLPLIPSLETYGQMPRTVRKPARTKPLPSPGGCFTDLGFPLGLLASLGLPFGEAGFHREADGRLMRVVRLTLDEDPCSKAKGIEG